MRSLFSRVPPPLDLSERLSVVPRVALLEVCAAIGEDWRAGSGSVRERLRREALAGGGVGLVEGAAARFGGGIIEVGEFFS